jgi:hypothetical protein
MKGRYDVVLYNNKVHYHLTIKRNITILRGDSASGKFEFIRLLAQYNGSPKSSGISLICDRECIVLNEGNWKLYLETYRERIFFIDEGNDFLRTKEFADAVKGADNYFVIISRENFPNLPYSVDEIYGLREGKYREAKRVYNEMYRIYGNLPDPQQKPEIVITEDSNSGNEFFELLFPGKCISANGKSNIKRVLLEHMGESVLAVVDGAAFGPEMQDCMELTEVYPVSIFAPESFEFLILESGLIEVPMTVLEQTWDYADSVKYFSWEEFYTWYLSDISRNEVYQYSKRKLNNFFKTAGSIKRMAQSQNLWDLGFRT